MNKKIISLVIVIAIQSANVTTTVTPVTVAIHKASGTTNRTMQVDYIKYYKLK